MRALRFVVGMFLATVTLTAWAAVGDVAAPAGAATAHGVYLLTFDLSGATQMPAGARIRCKARVIPHLGSGGNLSMEPAVTGIASTGSKPECRVELPFSWTVKAHDGAILSYEIEVVSGEGTRVWAVAGQGIGVSFPQAGTIARMNFMVRF
jgi:hypothetical protein